MKVILLEKIYRLGELGDTVQVKAGYARNYLIPQGKAIRATKENIKAFEARRAELEKAAVEVLNTAKENAEKIQAIESLTIVRRAAEEGKLFGSVGIRDIVDALLEKGITVEKREVNLLSGPMRQIGEYEVEIVPHSDLKVMLKVNIEAEEGTVAEKTPVDSSPPLIKEGEV